MAVLVLTGLVSYSPRLVQNVAEALLQWLFWIGGVIWALSVFLVARQPNRSYGGRLGVAVFGLTLILIAISVAMQSWLGAPLYWTDDFSVGLFLVFGAVFLAVVCLGLAASTIDSVEGRSGWPFKWSTFGTIAAILFLPVGIWFLRERVLRLLNEA